MAAHLMRPSRPWMSSTPSPLSLPLRSLRPTIPTAAASALNCRHPIAFKSTAGRKPTKKPGSNTSVNTVPSFLLPNTLVAPPIWRYPNHPLHFWRMLKLHIKSHTDAWWALFGFKVMSQPKFIISRPRFKANRKAAIPVAKALHQEMSEALASGEKDILRRVCTTDYANKLIAVVDARPTSRLFRWELLKNNSTWYYPRLSSWQVVMQPTAQGQVAIKQAVVSIASRQRLTQYDKANKTQSDPSTSERDMLEHIVIQANIDLKTYESGPWKIWGTIPESTLESHEENLRQYQAFAQGDSKK